MQSATTGATSSVETVAALMLHASAQHTVLHAPGATRRITGTRHAARAAATQPTPAEDRQNVPKLQQSPWRSVDGHPIALDIAARQFTPSPTTAMTILLADWNVLNSHPSRRTAVTTVTNFTAVKKKMVAEPVQSKGNPCSAFSWLQEGMRYLSVHITICLWLWDTVRI